MWKWKSVEVSEVSEVCSKVSFLSPRSRLRVMKSIEMYLLRIPSSIKFIIVWQNICSANSQHYQPGLGIIYTKSKTITKLWLKEDKKQSPNSTYASFSSSQELPLFTPPTTKKKKTPKNWHSQFESSFNNFFPFFYNHFCSFPIHKPEAYNLTILWWISTI